MINEHAALSRAMTDGLIAQAHDVVDHQRLRRAASNMIAAIDHVAKGSADSASHYKACYRDLRMALSATASMGDTRHNPNAEFMALGIPAMLMHSDCEM